MFKHIQLPSLVTVRMTLCVVI